jgi:hypothetical protein
MSIKIAIAVEKYKDSSSSSRKVRPFNLETRDKAELPGSIVIFIEALPLLNSTLRSDSKNKSEV